MRERKVIYYAMNIERLYLMNKRIENETTGTPEEFANELNIKKRQLRNQLEEIRLLGVSIKYSRKKKTYFYDEPFDFFEKLDYQHIISKLNKKVMAQLLKVYLQDK